MNHRCTEPHKQISQIVFILFFKNSPKKETVTEIGPSGKYKLLNPVANVKLFFIS